MDDQNTSILVIQLIQSSLITAIGITLLYLNRSLTRGVVNMFKAVYGKTLKIEWVFETKYFVWYVRLAFITMGILAFVGAVFNVTGPINNW